MSTQRWSLVRTRAGNLYASSSALDSPPRTQQQTADDVTSSRQTKCQLPRTVKLFYGFISPRSNTTSVDECTGQSRTVRCRLQAKIEIATALTEIGSVRDQRSHKASASCLHVPEHYAVVPHVVSSAVYQQDMDVVNV